MIWLLVNPLVDFLSDRQTPNSRCSTLTTRVRTWEQITGLANQGRAGLKATAGLGFPEILARVALSARDPALSSLNRWKGRRPEGFWRILGPNLVLACESALAGGAAQTRAVRAGPRTEPVRDTGRLRLLQWSRILARRENADKQ